MLFNALWALVTLAPNGQRYTSTCYWCGHEVASRSKGIAELRMSFHFGFSEDDAPQDPDLLPDPILEAVHDHMDADLTEVSACS